MSTSISCPCSVTEECESIKNFTISVQDDLQHISEIQWNKHIPEWNVLMQHDSLAYFSPCKVILFNLDMPRLREMSKL